APVAAVVDGQVALHGGRLRRPRAGGVGGRALRQAGRQLRPRRADQPFQRPRRVGQRGAVAGKHGERHHASHRRHPFPASHPGPRFRRECYSLRVMAYSPGADRLTLTVYWPSVGSVATMRATGSALPAVSYRTWPSGAKMVTPGTPARVLTSTVTAWPARASKSQRCSSPALPMAAVRVCPTAIWSTNGAASSPTGGGGVPGGGWCCSSYSARAVSAMAACRAAWVWAAPGA